MLKKIESLFDPNFTKFPVLYRNIKKSAKSNVPNSIVSMLTPSDFRCVLIQFSEFSFLILLRDSFHWDGLRSAARREDGRRERRSR